MNRDNQKRLILFDIDGTILNPGKGAREALKKAVYLITGEKIANLRISDTAGKTDKLIVLEIFKKIGYPEEKIIPQIDTILEKYVELLDETYNRERDAFLYPGSFELIEKLDRQENTYLGLLTGNVENGARKKLAPFNINHFFKFGAFGNDGFYREELPEIAKRRGENYARSKFRNGEVFVIGDTANDVRCGKIIGAKTIAVNRFKEFYNDLLKSEPDYIFDGFENISEILEAIYRSN